MLTRVEISGFKSFVDFSVDLGPLTVIAGANASGKSNFFEALDVISKVATVEDWESSVDGRGLLSRSFTKYSGNHSADMIKFAVEFTLPIPKKDNFFQPLKYRSFRYAVSLKIGEHFGYRGLLITDEFLINTEEESARPLIYCVDKEDKVIKGEKTILSDLRLDLKSSALSQATFTGDAYKYSCREYLKHIRLLNLSAVEHFTDYGRKSDSNVLATLTRTKQVRPSAFGYLSQRLRDIISDFSEVNVYTDDLERRTVTATDRDGRQFSAEYLSEGTLRTIVLATLLLPQSANQIIMIEEPENGIDPRVLAKLVHLMADIVSQPPEHNRASQIICSTHSPVLLQAALNLNREVEAKVLLSTKVSYIHDTAWGRVTAKVTRFNPVVDEASVNGSITPIQRYTLSMAQDYLNAGNVPQTQEDA